MIGELPAEGQESSIAWIPLDGECHEINNVAWEIMEFKGLIYEESKYGKRLSLAACPTQL